MQSEKTKYHYFNYFILKNFNPVIRFLTLADMLIAGGFGLIVPIFAVYITDNIQSGTVEVVGIASTIFLLTKCLLQIAVGAIIDKYKSEYDDFFCLLAGSIIYSIIPLFYIFVTTPFQLYLAQFVYGLAAAFAYPTWMSIFTRHIDRDKEGVEWSIYATFTEFGMAIAASLGGFVAYRYGFKLLFVVASIIIFLSSLSIIAIYNKIRSR